MTKCWAVTHVGKVRCSNEDFVEVSSRPPEGKLDCWEGDLSYDYGWGLVADGMGGHAAGEIASELAIELLRPVMHLLDDEAEVLLALNATNGGLFDAMERNPALEGMGTTVAGVVLRGTEALTFNVGDSRIYTFSNNRLAKISCDHVVNGNQLTQCLGASGQMSLRPHVSRFALGPYSNLVICSDGLTDMVTDEEIAESLAVHSANPALKLVDAALRAGGIDNISVVVLEISEGGQVGDSLSVHQNG